MTTCRIDLLNTEAAQEAAAAVKLLPALADLNIFRALSSKTGMIYGVSGTMDLPCKPTRKGFCKVM